MALRTLLGLLIVSALLGPAATRAASDSDGDGYADRIEVSAGYDPFGPGKPSGIDLDLDGLMAQDEAVFGTDDRNPDSDGDGFPDIIEIVHGYDPAKADPKARLKKRIVISLKKQDLTYFIGPKAIATHKVSSGRIGMSTPVGTYKILNKHPRAWSAASKLWMPYWMAFKGSAYGIHELPEWPNGTKEGENHLGKPVSHGCIRLGIGPAKTLYDWADVGTEVVVQK